MGSLKQRFEVFKRDQFQCQYCGRTPPAVVLEVDHIIPRKASGPDTIDNLITSCFDCNRGKAAVPLTEAPEALVNRMALVKEKQAQLRAYQRLLEKQERWVQSQIADIQAAYSKLYPGWVLSDSFCDGSLRVFLKSLTATEIKEAFAIASTRCRNDNQAIKYFCGICWNWIKDPDTRGR